MTETFKASDSESDDYCHSDDSENMEEYEMLWNGFQDVLDNIRLGTASEKNRDIINVIESDKSMVKEPDQVFKIHCQTIRLGSYEIFKKNIYFTRKAIYITEVPEAQYNGILPKQEYIRKLRESNQYVYDRHHENSFFHHERKKITLVIPTDSDNNDGCPNPKINIKMSDTGVKETHNFGITSRLPCKSFPRKSIGGRPPKCRCRLHPCVMFVAIDIKSCQCIQKDLGLEEYKEAGWDFDVTSSNITKNMITLVTSGINEDGIRNDFGCFYDSKHSMYEDKNHSDDFAKQFFINFYGQQTTKTLDTKVCEDLLDKSKPECPYLVQAKIMFNPDDETNDSMADDDELDAKVEKITKIQAWIAKSISLSIGMETNDYDGNYKIKQDFQVMLKNMQLGEVSKKDAQVLCLIENEERLCFYSGDGIIKFFCPTIRIGSYEFYSRFMFCTSEAIYIEDALNLGISSKKRITLVFLSRQIKKIEMSSEGIDEPQRKYSPASGIRKERKILYFAIILNSEGCERIKKDLDLDNEKSKSLDFDVSSKERSKNTISFTVRQEYKYEKRDGRSLKIFKNFYGKKILLKNTKLAKKHYEKTKPQIIPADLDLAGESEDVIDDGGRSSMDQTKAKKRKISLIQSDTQNQATTSNSVEKSSGIDFQTYIDDVKGKKLPWEIFGRFMKDLTANDLKKTEALNLVLLQEWKDSLEKITVLEAENERLENLNNEAMDVSNVMFQQDDLENNEIKEEIESAD